MSFKLDGCPIVPLDRLAVGTPILFVIPKYSKPRKFSNGKFVQEKELDNLVSFISKAKKYNNNDLEIFDLRKMEDKIELLKIYKGPSTVYDDKTPEKEKEIKKENESFEKALYLTSQENPSDVKNEKVRFDKDINSKIIYELFNFKNNTNKLLLILKIIKAIAEEKEVIILS